MRGREGYGDPCATGELHRPGQESRNAYRGILAKNWLILWELTGKMFCYNPPGLSIRRSFHMQFRIYAWHDDVDLRHNDTAEDGGTEDNEELDDDDFDDDDDDDFDDDDLDEELDDDELDDLDEDDRDDDDEEASPPADDRGEQQLAHRAT